MDYRDKLRPGDWYIFTPPRWYIFSPPLTADFEYLIDDLEKRLAGTRSAKRQKVLRDAISSAQERLQFFTRLLPDESYERWSARYPADGELVEISVPRVKSDGFR